MLARRQRFHSSAATRSAFRGTSSRRRANRTDPDLLACKLSGARAILILIDSERDCPAQLAPQNPRTRDKSSRRHSNRRGTRQARVRELVRRRGALTRRQVRSPSGSPGAGGTRIDSRRKGMAKQADEWAQIQRRDRQPVRSRSSKGVSVIPQTVA